MQALILPARSGWRWIADGYRIYSKNRLMLSLIVFSYWLMMVMVNSVPVLGQIVATVFLPAMSVGLMNACRRVEHGESIAPQVMFSGLAENLRTLLLLGLIYLLAALSIFALTSLIDGGTLFDLFVVGGQFDETSSPGAMMLSAQVAMALFVPLVMAFWYAPVLSAWHGYTAGKSLFFSLVACLRNWRPFVVYSFGLLVGGLAMIIVAGLLSAVMPGMGRAALFAVAFFGMPIMYASFYVSYRDVFVSVDENA